MPADRLEPPGAALAGNPGAAPDAASYVRFCPGLAFIPADDGLIVDGGLRRRRLTGPAALHLMPRLTPLLDGRRTAGQIADAVGLPLPSVRQALSVLREADLVEDGDRPLVADGALAAPHAATFLSRTVHATGRHRNSAELFDALAGSSVLVLAGGPTGEALRSDLARCGIGQVLAGDAGDAAATARAVTALAGSPCPLVAAVDDGVTWPAMASAAAACWRERVPLLRGARRGAEMEIGPLFFPGHTACVECFRRGVSVHQDNGPDGDCAAGLCAEAADQALAVMLADEVLAALGAVRATRGLRIMTMTSLEDGNERRLLVLPDPHCAVCGPGFPAAEPADDAAAYEWEVAHTPPWLRAPGSATAIRQAAVHGLASQRPYLGAGPRYQLPAAAAAGTSDAAPAKPAGRLDIPALAGILARVAGRRHPEDPTDLRRWAPSGGNLASVRLYVAASGAGFGPAAGRLTAYDDMAHQIAAVRALPVSAGRLLAGTGLQAAEECIVLVFVADVARIARKYRGFSYRLAHLDSGVAAAQLAVVAWEAGLRVVFAPAWPGQLSEVCELRPGEEFVTALALVTREETADAADR
jgi:DNA-binding transcriptional ArsR family regulator